MKVLVDGQLIEYKDEGKGKAVLLLHGWGSSLATFNEMATYLSKKFRVIRLDFPGFGASPKPSNDWGVEQYARLTAAFLKKLKVTELHAVAGHSFGGRVIIKGFSTKVLTADKVVLLGAAGPKPSQKAKKLIFQSIAKVGKAATALPGLRKLRPKLQRKLYAAAGSTDYLEAQAMRQIFLNTVNEDLLPEVSAIDVSTLMIWGENDQEVPVSDARRMQALIKRSELIVVPDAGHFVHIDDAAEVKTRLEAFL